MKEHLLVDGPLDQRPVLGRSRRLSIGSVKAFSQTLDSGRRDQELLARRSGCLPQSLDREEEAADQEEVDRRREKEALHVNSLR